ncbi:MAG TPA: hypothetical protein VFL91_34120 [Thermomicrobiales bacterium]|nr:hypothetical protein [Thermomicrobiales bacterium]
MHEYMLALPAQLHRDEVRREANRIHRAEQARRRTGRERLAGALVALAARLAPASQAAPARRVAKSGQPA